MMFRKYNILHFVVLLLVISYTETCIKLLNGSWKPISLQERTKSADLVVTAKILYTTPIPGQLLFYSATFEVLNVLKGWDVLKTLHNEKSKSINSLSPKIIVSAKGFGDSRLCFSNVEVGESYALFLGYRKDVQQLVAKYDDIFGAADLLYKRTERDILQSLGWQEWSGWSKCDKYCGSGTQERKRECHKAAEIPCKGPNRQKRECNTYECSESTNILPFILEYQDQSDRYPWKPRGETFDNALEERSVSKAPTHLLFSEEFPKDSVLHISFRGPVKETQFIYSVYNANNQMKFGLKLSPYNLDFVYDKQQNYASSVRRSNSFPHVFSEDMWYTIALLLKNDEVRVNINCEQVQASALDGHLFQDFDIFGHMFIGADKNTGKQQKVKVEIGQITLVKNPSSFWKQCGKVLEPEVNDKEPPSTVTTKIERTDVVISGDGPLSGPDDSEGGDVDENYGSGEKEEKKEEEEKEERCHCLNGGVCQKDGSCLCPAGYEDEKCSKPVCKNKCMNDGECARPNTCKCKKGTSGKYCQFTECQLPCKNGGMCIGPNTCNCKDGFEGSQCQNAKCSAKCENGGSCTERNKCRCPSGFKGDRCQYKETCKSYVTKLVSHLKPALVYKFIDVIEPCDDNKQKKCKKKKLKRGTVNHITYRPEYVCKT